MKFAMPCPRVVVHVRMAGEPTPRWLASNSLSVVKEHLAAVLSQSKADCCPADGLALGPRARLPL